MTRVSSDDKIVLTIGGAQRELKRSQVALFETLKVAVELAEEEVAPIPEKVTSAAWSFLESHLDTLYKIVHQDGTSSHLRPVIIASCRQLPC